MGQTHLYLIRTHRSNSRAAKGRHGGATHPAWTQTQSPATTTAATTTPAGTQKAEQKAGENIPHQNNPSWLQGHDIIQRYRLNWQAIQQLLRNIEPQLAPTLLTPRTIPTETKLLAVLHMLASGSFQSTGALVAGMSRPSFSAFLPKVLDAIIGLTPPHLLPKHTAEAAGDKQGFYLINGFPHVLGAIDCTHVRLVPPAATEHLYRNRKHTHSINVQAIVDHQGLITNIVSKYPGSVHDSFIFRHCTINQHFQDGRYGKGLLVEGPTRRSNSSRLASTATRPDLLVRPGKEKSQKKRLSRKFGGRWLPPAKLTPPNDRSAVKRPQGPFRLSRKAGGRPPRERPPAHRERPCNTEAGSEWSRRCCRGATGAVAPVAIFTVCYADSENHAGALLGGPCTAHASGMGSAGSPRGPRTPVPAILFLAVKTARNRLAGRGSESPWRRCLQRRHGGFSQLGLIRRETAGPGWATAALQPQSEYHMKHHQPVGGASVDSHPGGL
ncbi:hypothetical protein NDU88_002553 [Pleurodeles waltl]|uniref:DDE Tnp4 domain-containing protein n=1 Tax=Pleurodeles waltl TaxID=8319 RepID=A0AAV7L3V4_PLEWA|nr:hypothetical protein NDU88_002553 [Pleurodeles waltl]